MFDVIIDRVTKLASEKGESPTKTMLLSKVGKDFFYNLRQHKKPSAEKIGKLAAYFNVSTDYLLGLTDDPTPPQKPKSPLTEKREGEIMDALDKIGALSSDGTLSDHGREVITEFLRNNAEMLKQLMDKKG